MSHSYTFFMILPKDKKLGAFERIIRTPPTFLNFRESYVSVPGRADEVPGNHIQTISIERIRDARDVQIVFLDTQTNLTVSAVYYADCEQHGPQLMLHFDGFAVEKDNEWFLRVIDAFCAIIKPDAIVQESLTPETEGVLAFENGVPNHVRVAQRTPEYHIADFSKKVEAFVKKHKNPE